MVRFCLTEQILKNDRIKVSFAIGKNFLPLSPENKP